ncbi:protein of unknown function (plasmid) [Caballeronia sp. S22]
MFSDSSHLGFLNFVEAIRGVEQRSGIALRCRPTVYGIDPPGVENGGDSMSAQNTCEVSQL